MQNGYDPVKAEQMGQAMFALLILGILWALSRVWCSRVERRMVIRPSDSFWRAYGRLLWRQSWRSLVLTAAMGVFLGLGRDAYDAGQKIGSVVGLYPLLFIVIAARAWRVTKRLFRDRTAAVTSAQPPVRPPRPEPLPSNPHIRTPPALDHRIRKQMNRLKGWQRAWVVFGIIWTVLAWMIGMFDIRHIGHIGPVMIFWAFPIIATYGLGAAVAWIRAGFRERR